jgi:endoglucanase
MKNLVHRFGDAARKSSRATAGAAFVLLVAACSSPTATGIGGAPQEVAPGHDYIHYEGRIDSRDPAQFTMSLPGSAVFVRFRGTGFDARMSTTIRNHVQVVIDGKPAANLTLAKEPALYPVASGLPDAEHTAVLYKCTEANRGRLQFQGLRLEPGTRLLRARGSRRNIEFIGDSITAGYGDTAANEREPVSPENSNWYVTYAAVTARELGAGEVTVAVSGIRLTQSGDWPAMPRVYRRPHPNDPDYLWDFNRGPVPDVVVINLATNDFRKAGPDEDEWTRTYGEFLDFVRSQRPNAEIYVADGPLMSGTDLEHVRAWNREVVSRRRVSGDRRCHTISFPEEQASDGFGSDFHPNVATNRKMAEQLVAAIKADTGW